MPPNQTISEELQKLRAQVKDYEGYLKAAYAALQANGASLPEKRNAANLAGVITANTGGATLAALQAALNAASSYDDLFAVFPIGTEIADTWAGYYNPWVIVGKQNVASGGVSYIGLKLIRKYSYGQPQAMFSGTAAVTYPNTQIATLLKGRLLSECSPSVDKYAVNFSINLGTDLGGSYSSKLWLPSADNVSHEATVGTGADNAFDAFDVAQKIYEPAGSTTAQARLYGAPSVKGKLDMRDGELRECWTRTQSSNTSPNYRTFTGNWISTTRAGSVTTVDICPMIFMRAGRPV